MGQCLHQNQLGHKDGVVIKLLDEFADQHAELAFIGLAAFGRRRAVFIHHAIFHQRSPLQNVIFAANQAPIAHGENLDSGVGRAGILRHGNIVCIFHGGADDLLLLHNALGGFDAVSIDSGQFELEIFSGLFHLAFHLNQHIVRVALQKVHHLLQHFAIFSAILLANAGAATKLDVVVETRSSIVTGNLAVAI